jgi:7,8-dihydropterin-6-yl-methyl-4-(beta-D-ribofuranosyl)aminobenzene 5'-phosphate synthase
MAPFCDLTIVYDSDGLPGFETGWGFSALVERDGDRTLFDCGWDGHMLRWNLGRLGLTFADIDRVVLSHQHWDHISGLTEMLSEPLRPEPMEVAVPASFSGNLKKEIGRKASLRELDGPEELWPGIFTTGQLGDSVKEQSLILVHDGKGIVVTGCAHPGIDRIMERARDVCDPAWLMGGLHGARREQIPDNLDRVVLCHCTKDKDGIMAAVGEKAILGRVGETYAPEW